MTVLPPSARRRELLGKLRADVPSAAEQTRHFQSDLNKRRKISNRNWLMTACPRKRIGVDATSATLAGAAGLM
jgi:hypothetical protein